MEAVNTKLQVRDLAYIGLFAALMAVRSEERRVGKECL